MIKKLTLITVLLSLACYAFIYFSHSYGPHDQYPDSKHYYNMVESPLDLNAAPAPFVYRQFTTYLTSVAIKFTSNLSYKNIYSFLFLTNLMGIFLTMILLSYYILNDLKIHDISNVILAPLLLFLSYKVMHQAIGNLCEGWVYFFITLIFILFQRNQLIFMFLCLIFSLFVKETIALYSMLFFGSLLIISLFRPKTINKKSAIAFLSSFSIFLTYFIVRKHWLIVPGFENQITLSTYPMQFLEFIMNFEVNSFLKLILHQNSILILIILLIYQKGFGQLIYSNDILACFVSIFVLIIICASTGMMYNDISRIISSSIPLAILIFWERIFVND